MYYFLVGWEFKALFLVSCSVFPAAAMVGAAFASAWFAALSVDYYSLYCSRLGVLDTIKLNLQEIVKGVYPVYFNKISFLIDACAQARLYESLSFIFLFYCAMAAVAYAAWGGAEVFWRRDLAAGPSGSVICGGESRGWLRRAAGRAILVSAVFLAAGLYAPIIAIKATGEIPVIGGTSVLKFQAKGIIETISKLFAGGYPLPASLILLFSVIVPAAKLVLCALALGPGGARYGAALRLIGKWSMADVFTASIILAYLAFGADKFTDAWLLSGFYFFCGYCLISLAIAQAAVAFAAGEGGPDAGLN